MAIAVKRVKSRKHMTDPTSQELYYLRPVPGKKDKVFSTKQIARRIEKVGSLSAEDVAHVTTAVAREIKELLTEGYSVRIDELGTFHLTFNSKGVQEEKECTVRNIHKVNIRFKVDKALRLVNDTTAPTRSENNVLFYMDNMKTTESSGKTDDDAGGDIDPGA